MCGSGRASTAFLSPCLAMSSYNLDQIRKSERGHDCYEQLMFALVVMFSMAWMLKNSIPNSNQKCRLSLQILRPHEVVGEEGRGKSSENLHFSKKRNAVWKSRN